MRSALLPALLLAALAGCSRPEPPSLTPRSAEVTQATATGLGLRVHLTARNPNAINLTVRSLAAHVIMAGRDLGTVTVNDATTLRSNQDVPVSVPITVAWTDLPGLLVVTAASASVPYHLDGTVNVGGENANFTVPFQMDSTIPREVLVNAARNSVPAVPGVQVPTQLPTQLPTGLPTPAPAPAPTP